MVEGAACLLDSNILLRVSKNDDLQQPIIANALKSLIGQGVRLCYTSQTLAEFWNASTRPADKNGFGLTVAETDRLARVIERDFELLPDSRETHERWRVLLVQHSIHGVQVHDARLAASMYVHAVNQLLTINVRDFQRLELRTQAKCRRLREAWVLREKRDEGKEGEKRDSLDLRDFFALRRKIAQIRPSPILPSPILPTALLTLAVGMAQPQRFFRSSIQ